MSAGPASRCDLDAAAILFDLDGVLADSTAAVERTWLAFAAAHDIPTEGLFDGLHGRRMVDILTDLLPDHTPAQRAGAATEIDDLEARHAPATRAQPGARELIASLPDRRWAIATSSTQRVATARLAALGIEPAVLVTADDISAGKPDPAPYLLAADLLGVDPADTIVIEDAPSGIAAGLHAGATVVAVTTSHRPDELHEAHHRIGGVADLTVQVVDGRIHVSWPCLRGH